MFPTKVTATPSTQPKANLTVHWQPSRLVNGSPIVFRVTTPSTLDSLTGNWLGHEVVFSLDSGSKEWVGIAGVSLETRPGRYALDLKGTVAGKSLVFQRKIEVGKAKYRSIAVTVAKQYTEPNPEQLQKIDADRKLKQQVFAKVSPDREWQGSFLAPVKAEISGVFGTARTFNGRIESVHQGLDYAVHEGTPVAAVNSGTVLLAQPLFFEGNCIILDHGQGLLSIYMHLSKIEVKEGDSIKRGQAMALSGGTGRATGPHLHVAVRWQGIYVDPATLLTLKLP